MFKHRDNTTHPPLATDPKGNGVTMRAVRFADSQTPNDKDTNILSAVAAGAAPTAAGRKRPRDIRSITKFREVVYGEKGLPRLHGMISRNPILMYPPDGVDAARRRLLEKRRHEMTNSATEGPLEDAEMMALFEARRHAEEAANAMSNTSPSRAEKDAANSPSPPAEAELGTYHHRQLDALMGVLYEFNHLTFMKLPMSDTLQLLQRCGKEAVAHCMEFEMHLRTPREAKLQELHDMVLKEAQLEQRRLKAQEEALTRELHAAEEAQRGLEAEAEVNVMAEEEVGWDGDDAVDGEVKANHEVEVSSQDKQHEGEEVEVLYTKEV